MCLIPPNECQFMVFCVGLLNDVHLNNVHAETIFLHLPAGMLMDAMLCADVQMC